MSDFAAGRSVATVALVVKDYDEAIRWYVDRAGFVLTSDVDLGGGKRWVTVQPASGQGAKLLLAKADGPVQSASVGNQTGGRVFLFLETDDFERDHAAILLVAMAEGPAPGACGGNQSGGRVFLFWSPRTARASPRR